MIILKSVRLSNFRAVEDATFEPNIEGITGLSGPNGVGKSSFLDGTLWALFGQLPDGVQQALLRRQGSTLDEECFVEVVLEHDGQEVVVTRSLQGKNGTAVLNTWVDGQEQTIKSVKVGQNWIKTRLGVDAKGFTTAVLIPQKQLDMLVNAKPSDRRMLIEDLSGVSRMSNALTAARKEANAAKALVAEMNIDPEDLVNAQERVAESEEFHKNVQEQISVAQGAVKDAEAIALSLEDHLKSLEEQVANAENARYSVNSAQQNVNLATHRLNDSQKRLERASKDVSPESEVIDAAAASEAVRQASVRLNEVREHSRQQESTRTTLKNQSEFKHDQNIELRQKVETISEWVAKTKKTLEETADTPEQILALQEVINQDQEEKNAHNATVITLKFEIQQLQESIAKLSNGHDNSCPTCQSHLDNPQALVESMKLVLTSLQDQKNDIVHHIETINQKHRENAVLLQQLEARQNEISKRTLQVAEGEERIAENKQKISENERQMSENKEEIIRLNKEHETILQKERTVEVEYNRLREELLSIREKERAREEYIQASREFDEAKTNLHESQVELERAKETLSSLDAPSQEDVTTARNNVRDASDECHQLQVALSQREGELRLAAEKLDRAQSDLEREHEKIKARQDLLSTAEQKKAIASLLEEFRLDQISRIAPELSDNASNLISQMTNGFYTEIRLDEEFTPFVVNEDGEIRPATMLSGGEVSVVALALRIAIGDMITNNTGGLLWLDEVLTAQDAQRRTSLIETLRTLSNRQIIMINHTQGADDIVDRNVRLIRGENGTIVDDS